MVLGKTLEDEEQGGLACCSPWGGRVVHARVSEPHGVRRCSDFILFHVVAVLKLPLSFTLPASRVYWTGSRRGRGKEIETLTGGCGCSVFVPCILTCYCH